jgi:hypothetical protein
MSEHRKTYAEQGRFDYRETLLAARDARARGVARAISNTFGAVGAVVGFGADIYHSSRNGFSSFPAFTAGGFAAGKLVGFGLEQLVDSNIERFR